MAEKVANYYRRGGRPLSIEEIQQVLNEHPWIPAPKEVVILDGDVRTEKGVAVGLTPRGERLVILTPISDQETVLHELVHEGFGLGELPTQIVTRVLSMKPTLFPRNVKYRQCLECESHPEMIGKALEKLGIRPEFAGRPNVGVYEYSFQRMYGQYGGGYPYPNIRHYRLEK